MRLPGARSTRRQQRRDAVRGLRRGRRGARRQPGGVAEAGARAHDVVHVLHREAEAAQRALVRGCRCAVDVCVVPELDEGAHAVRVVGAACSIAPGTSRDEAAARQPPRSADTVCTSVAGGAHNQLRGRPDADAAAAARAHAPRGAAQHGCRRPPSVAREARGRGATTRNRLLLKSPRETSKQRRPAARVWGRLEGEGERAADALSSPSPGAERCCKAGAGGCVFNNKQRCAAAARQQRPQASRRRPHGPQSSRCGTQLLHQ